MSYAPGLSTAALSYTEWPRRRGLPALTAQDSTMICITFFTVWTVLLELAILTVIECEEALSQERTLSEKGMPSLKPRT